MTGHQGFRVYALTGSGFSVALCVAAGVVQVTGHFPVPGVMLAGFLLISLGYAFAAWALIENRFFSSMVRIQVDRGYVVCDSGLYRIVTSRLCWKYTGTPGYGAGLGLDADTYSGGGCASHHGDKNGALRPKPEGRVAGLSRLCAPCALSVDSGDLLKR